MGQCALLAAAAIGVNVHLPPTDTLDLTGDLGASWVRIDFNWDIAEPQKGTYNWAPFDAVIDAANARGLKVFATIGYGAAWASVSGDRLQDGPGNDVPDAAEYQRFVHDAAARYANGRVSAWGTWNEPNLEDFFEGTQQEWVDNALLPALAGIESGCPACLKVGPELASIGTEYDDYLAAALDAAGNRFDAISWHIYASFPEDDIGAGSSKDSFYNKLEQHRVSKLGMTVVYEGPLSLREVMAQKNVNLPVWITETGRQAMVGDMLALEGQRKFMQRVLSAMDTRSWWQRTFFYEISEEHPNGMWPDIHWGLALRVAGPDNSYTDNFLKKPAFDELKSCLVSRDCCLPSDPGSGGAGGGAGMGSGGSAGTNSGGTSGAAGGNAGAGGMGTGGASSAPASEDNGGCGCQLPTQRKPLDLAAWLATLVAVLGLRRYGSSVTQN